jgi:hypothetical protein
MIGDQDFPALAHNFNELRNVLPRFSDSRLFHNGNYATCSTTCQTHHGKSTSALARNAPGLLSLSDPLILVCRRQLLITVHWPPASAAPAKCSAGKVDGSYVVITSHNQHTLRLIKQAGHGVTSGYPSG